MKFVVISWREHFAALVLLGVLFASTADAENRADCGRPPGGSVTCEDEQLAFCRVVRGEAEGSCKTPPKKLKGKALAAWAYSEITGKRVDLNEERDVKEMYKELLWLEGHGLFGTANFSLPKKEIDGKLLVWSPDDGSKMNM